VILDFDLNRNLSHLQKDSSITNHHSPYTTIFLKRSQLSQSHIGCPLTGLIVKTAHNSWHHLIFSHSLFLLCGKRQMQQFTEQMSQKVRLILLVGGHS